ncbi:FAD:protein FMN transferase [Sphingomonas sp. M1-B02]|uniref:FAD:protein FMN transferase n=1 Tax=Sphingomonas sp. M1-B02 TaxID=3114300 RepID=UPI0022406AF4|nr:FAD:protein FMN transferase [Sphingomonas sp. S6-11]
MGTSWSVRLVAPKRGLPGGLQAGVEAVLARIIAQMSQWEPSSDISRFNRSAPGSWQRLPPEFVHVLTTALAVSDKSEGAFDPALGIAADHWGFGASEPPSRPELEAVPSGRASIELDALLLRARRTARAALDFSGIAKGYAVDRVAAHLHQLGLTDFLVEIGGELSGHGIKPDGQPWWVELEQPPGLRLPGLRVALHGLAIATSGDYRRTVEKDGKRLGHTLDPRTGRPLENQVASLTVLHAECMLADAWATALTVLGPERGPAIAEREDLAMHMVVREGAGVREIFSPALEAMLG